MAENPSTPSTRTKDLLDRVRRNGDSRALSRLFREQGDRLRRWAHRRLPPWARRAADTVDVVQDALIQTFQRLDRFEDRGQGSLQAYLRQAVNHRIRDEMRRVVRRPTYELDGGAWDLPARDASPFDAAEQAEWERAYKAALQQLTEDERALVVGRLELDYSYEQLAMMLGRASPGAARIAARRAVTRLAEKMASA